MKVEDIADKVLESDIAIPSLLVIGGASLATSAMKITNAYHAGKALKTQVGVTETQKHEVISQFNTGVVCAELGLACVLGALYIPLRAISRFEKRYETPNPSWDRLQQMAHDAYTEGKPQ